MKRQIRFCFPREKKKEQERDELWRKLEELKLSSSAGVQNNSHRLPAVQNNNNNNNGHNNDEGVCTEADATPTDPASGADGSIQRAK